MKATRKEGGLRRRMLLMLLFTFVPITVIMWVMFSQTAQSQRIAAAESLYYTAGQISDNLDKIAINVYSVSDSFSTDQRLLAVIDKDFNGDAIEKSRVTTFILNALFESYNRLQPQERMDAVYVVPRDELFNFIDTNQDVAFVMKNLERLDVNAKDKLGKFHWYPLMPDFLKTTRYGEPRRDNVVIGSRRVYSAIRSGYPYIHIFSVEEQTLYNSYSLLAQSAEAQVYVIDQNGGLISSTDLQAVTDCTVPPALLQLLKTSDDKISKLDLNGVSYDTSIVKSDKSGWYTLVMVPASKATEATYALFQKILWVMIACLGACFFVVLYLYRLFMKPLAALADSIKKVDSGDLKAYVKPQGEFEMSKMLTRYNSMLDSIRRNIDDKVQMEASKKDLEMQVLTSQINPHFLYNTLETIVWRAGEVGSPDIGKTAASLGKLYRLSISGGLFVPLSQELAHLNAYINIQNARYGDKIVFDSRINNVNTDETKVLKLILQPVVENCFLYAADGLQRCMKIRMHIWQKNGFLYISVCDSGKGMSREAARQVQQQIIQGTKEQAKQSRSTGIGLHNIYARLQLYFGTDSDIKIFSKQNFGTKVVLKLKIKTQ